MPTLDLTTLDLPLTLAYSCGNIVPCTLSIDVVPQGDCLLYDGRYALRANADGRHAHHGYPFGCGALRELVWFDRHGKIPAGQGVRCSCGDVTCLSIGHLTLGPSARRGKPVRRLDADAVRAIRRSPASAYELARAYGVSAGTIANVRSGRTWRHVPETVNRGSRSSRAFGFIYRDLSPHSPAT